MNHHYFITEPSTPVDIPTSVTIEEPKQKPEKTREKPRAAAQPDRPARSLFFFTLQNPIRKMCYAIVEKKCVSDPNYTNILTLNSTLLQKELNKPKLQGFRVYDSCHHSCHMRLPCNGVRFS